MADRSLIIFVRIVRGFSSCVKRERHVGSDGSKGFRSGGDAAFGKPEIYEYCESKRITYFIRLKSNNSLMDLIQPDLKRPVGRPPESGIPRKLIDFYYQAKSWDKARRVICKNEGHEGELFPRIEFIVANSRFAAGKVVKVYNGRAEIENRIKGGKDRLRSNKTRVLGQQVFS